MKIIIGSSNNFLFSLSPKMAVYPSTGFNDHYQYLNIQQQTFPNGLVNSNTLMCLNHDRDTSTILNLFREWVASWNILAFFWTRSMVGLGNLNTFVL